MDIKNLSTLKIHKLTQEQYEREKAAGTLDESAFYLTPDKDGGGIYIGSGEMPEGYNVQIDPNGEIVTVHTIAEEVADLIADSLNAIIGSGVIE